MIFACGIDIEEIERFNKHYFDKGKLSDLIYDIFTSKEIENFSFFGKEAFLKGFSFKEAFYKALNNSDFGFKDVEIIFNDTNKFEIYPSRDLKYWLKKQDISQIEANCQSTNQFVIFRVLLIKYNSE